MKSDITIVTVLCLIGWSYESCSSDTTPVLSFCVTEELNATTVYLDSSKVPKSANITCDCDVGIKENVNISATSISHPDLVGISNDGLTFIQFSDGQHTWVGQKRVYVRYITYETIVNEVCLKFEGTVIEVSCQRVKTDKSRTTLQTDTKKTNPTTASTNHFTDDGNNDVPFHTTPQPKTQTEDAIQINNLQKSSHAVAIGVGAGVAGVLLIVAVIVGIVCFRRKRHQTKNDHSDDGSEEVENPMYDATEPHVTNSSTLKADSTTENDQHAVYYTSVNKIQRTQLDGGNTDRNAPLNNTDMPFNKESAIVNEPAYDSTYARPNKPPMSTYDKVTNASSNIDVDDYGYNVTTQNTCNRSNLPTDNIYNRLS